MFRYRFENSLYWIQFVFNVSNQKFESEAWRMYFRVEKLAIAQRTTHSTLVKNLKIKPGSK